MHEQDLQFALEPDGTYRVTGDMIIGDVVEAFPKAATIMLSHGLHCVGCHANAFDTVESGARGHGMPEEEIHQMIEEINTAINKKIETIELTPKAVTKVKELRALEAGKETWPLRIAVVPGGCSGFGYDMDFGEKKDGDIELTFDDLHVVVDPESMQLLKGSSIDFVDSLRGSGFKIENPNANRSCGCGKSFG
jgi:iron-sulfur cluster assembly accessory protein